MQFPVAAPYSLIIIFHTMTTCPKIRLAAVSLALYAISAGASATVIDSFANTATGATVSVSTGNGSWISESYAGADIYNNGTRLVAGRAGHSNGSSLAVDPTAGTLSNAASAGSALGIDVSYGTGIQAWYNTVWTYNAYGSKPVLAATGTASGQLNIAATLSDSIYIDSSSAGPVWTDIFLYSNTGDLLGTYSGNIAVGHNTISLGSFSGLTLAEAADIDGMRYSFYNKATVSEVGFNVSAPVPEPETYAMFLLGGAVLSAVARRRKAAR